MILSFSLPHFPRSILAGKKKTTIRRDEKKRWKVGQKIHFWKGSPRNKGSYAFATGVIKSVADIRLAFYKEGGAYEFPVCCGCYYNSSLRKRDAFAKREGFTNWEEFKTAFQKLHPGDVFEGRLITWEQPVIPL